MTGLSLGDALLRLSGLPPRAELPPPGEPVRLVGMDATEKARRADLMRAAEARLLAGLRSGNVRAEGSGARHPGERATAPRQPIPADWWQRDSLLFLPGTGGAWIAPTVTGGETSGFAGITVRPADIEALYAAEPPPRPGAVSWMRDAFAREPQAKTADVVKRCMVATGCSKREAEAALKPIADRPGRGRPRQKAIPRTGR